MITPLFRLTQDEEYLYVSLVVPNMRLAESELFYEGDSFVFHATPYYLRLEGLPGRVQASERIEVEDEQKQRQNQSLTPKKEITFDVEKGELLVPMAKETVGEHFDGLEAVGRFLSGPKTKPSRRLVEVLEGGDGEPEVEEEAEEEEDFDWNIEQTLPPEEGVGSLLGREPYGFANRHSGVLERLGDDLVNELVDIRQPGLKSRAQRREERLAQEEADFSEDHYIADLYDEEEVIGEIIKAEAPWQRWAKEGEESSILKDEDRSRLIDQIPKRPFLRYDQATTRVLLLGLADLLYAYAYDFRVTEWEHCSESAWTVRKLSPTLSWLEYWTTTTGSEENRDLKVESRQTVLVGCIRRSLIYPIYRNWKLSLKVAEDVVTILGAGQAAVLKCLLGKLDNFRRQCTRSMRTVATELLISRSN